MGYEIIIEPGRTQKHFWKDLLRYHELFFILSWRDLKVRYKQTLLGVIWSLLRPLLTILVFTLVFSKVAKLPSPGAIPYPLMVFAGMLPWQFFATGVTEASLSLVGNERLISKVYFPRLIIPAASVLTSLVDFFIALALMIILMFWLGTVPSWRVVFLPVFIVFTFLASFGPGLWLTAMNVKFRDFKHVVPFLVQLGLYISPVGFTSAIVPEKYQWLYHLNPMVGLIEGFRWCFFGDRVDIDWRYISISVAVTFFLMIVGVRTFRRMERSFADLI